jgi:hypothetical protein
LIVAKFTYFRGKGFGGIGACRTRMNFSA